MYNKQTEIKNNLPKGKGTKDVRIASQSIYIKKHIKISYKMTQ